MCGDRHDVAHRFVIFRSRQTIPFEQAHTCLLGNAPALGGKVIPYWVTLAGVDESGRVDVDAIDPPTNVSDCSSTHFVERVRVMLGGESRSWGAQRRDGVE
jgi:hypothetical protein